MSFADGNSPGTRGEPIMFFDAKGHGPYFHACQGASAVRAWLDRQITTGQVTAEERALVERMLDDMTEQDFCDGAYNGVIPPMQLPDERIRAAQRKGRRRPPPQGARPPRGRHSRRRYGRRGG